MKKAVSLFMLFALLIGTMLIPGNAANTNGFLYTDTGAGYIRIESYAGNDEIVDLEKLDISGTVSEIASEAFAYNETVKDISCNFGLDRIGKYAFTGCSELEKILLPDALTTICTGAFAECSSLTEITIPQTVVNFGSGIFDYANPDLIIGVYSGSAAEEYCKNNGYAYKQVDADCIHSFLSFEVYSIPTCTTAGEEREKCTVCGMFGEKTALLPALGHTWGEREEYGNSFIRTCEVCSQRAVGFTDIMNADALPFADLSSGKWYSDAMTFCYENKLLAGVSDTLIAPHTTLSRSMTVTILAKIAGAELTDPDEAVFDDVPAGKWYSASVKWAAENEIVSGYSDNIFAPRDPVTREQLALILYKYAQSLGSETEFDDSALDTYSDRDRVHSWAYDALCWAKDTGLISGITDTVIAPRDSSTRAQAAVMLTKFIDIFIPAEAAEYERVVIIGVDGAGAYWNQTSANNINKIFTSYTNTAKTPNASSCEENWASILHGVTADIHGITSFDNIPISRGSGIGYPSFMSLVRQRYADCELAAFSSWESLPFALIESDADVYTDYRSDDIRLTEDVILPYIEENDPKVMFVSYRNVALAVNDSDTGNYGGDFHLSQMSLTDNCIGAIYNRYSELGRAETTLFIITSDHGGVTGTTDRNNDSPESTNIFVGFAGHNLNSGELTGEIYNYDVAAVVLEALGIKTPANYAAKVPQGLFEE